MKRTLTALVISVSLLTATAGVSSAADFQKGLEAAQKGDFATALREWSVLAEKGFTDAQYNLGVLYGDSDGVTQDYKEAVKWYRKSAEQGQMKAQYNLGVMYGNGQGVLQDNVYSHMWFNIAASNGHENAVKNRDIVEKKMTVSDISKAQELARECVKKNYKGC